MQSFPRKRNSKPKEKTAFEIASNLYAGFNVENNSGLDEELNRWTELDRDDMLFTLGHLLFLLLKSHDEEVKLLRRLDARLNAISQQLEDLVDLADDGEDDEDDDLNDEPVADRAVEKATVVKREVEEATQAAGAGA